MLYRFDNKVCLNGYWDFLPVYDESVDETRVPEDGFGNADYLVPSFYNRPWDAVKFPGESYYHPVKERGGDTAREDADVLFEAYGYPAKWSAANAAWVRRGLKVDKKPGKRYFIVAEAAGPRATLYVNGLPVSEFRDYTLPFITDVTESIQDGDNSLAFLLSDYDYEDAEKRMTMWPSGGWTPYSMRGLWQDVYLVEKGYAYVDDVIIRTSVREGRIYVRATVKNASSGEFDGEMSLTVLNRDSNEFVAVIPDIRIPAGETREYVFEKEWTNAELWEPQTPNLYTLTVRLISDGVTVDSAAERFGFREVWLDGKDFMLNGHPIHMFSDWGHKTSPFQYTEGWIRKWFGMIKDFNMNHARLHTGPHPSLILDIADEMGIMITCETALHGSACEQGAASEVFWERALGHVDRLYNRDKNHPCVVMWSCENEMRWNTPSPESKQLVHEKLPLVRRRFESLDPTRPAYHEGDTACFNERELSILSRHYGREITGMAWWDKKKPLHSGEFGLYHLAGPNNTLQFGGDIVWTRQDYVNKYALEETRKNSLDARVNGVICLGPWNFSCLLNRREHAFKRFSYDDFTTPGMKPLYCKANTSEFRYWEEGKGYSVAPMTEDIPSIFRPFATIDLSLRTSYYASSPIRKTLFFVNDLPRDVNAVAKVALLNGTVVSEASANIFVGRGRVAEVGFDLAGDFAAGEYTLEATVSENGEIIDRLVKTLYLTDAVHCDYNGKIAVLGDGSAEQMLKMLNADYVRVSDVPDPLSAPVLLIERGYVRPKSDIKAKLRAFCAGGGRVILLEQSHSVFDGVQLSEKSLQTSFFRANSPLLRGIHEPELSYWDDSAYSAQKKETYVVERLYLKDDGSSLSAITDSGEGGFGDGDLERAPLVEAEEGAGLIIACQYLITSRFGLIPAALKLLANMIDRAYEYRPAEPREPLAIDRDGKNAEDILKSVYLGATAAAWDITDVGAKAISDITGVRLVLVEEPEGTFNCVRVPGEPAMNGISNADLCGIEKYNYVSHGRNLRIADRVIEKTEGLSPIALTCPESCLRPFYEYGGSSEILRVYTATNFCAHPSEREYVVAGKIAYGAGELFISMFRAPEGAPKRLFRFKNLLTRNIFGVRGASLLATDTVSEGAKRSDGYPNAVFVCENGSDAESMLDYCGMQIEHTNPRPLLEAQSFARVETKNGVLCAKQLYGAGDRVVYYTIMSPVTRKLEKNDLALPDPMAQTFLDISGQGEVAVWVNRALVFEGGLSDEIKTVADVDIENGFNHVLIRWKCVSDEDGLKMQWRNIMHEAETSFQF